MQVIGCDRCELAQRKKKPFYCPFGVGQSLILIRNTQRLDHNLSKISVGYKIIVNGFDWDFIDYFLKENVYDLGEGNA